jgi:hypothetical protein
MAGITSSRQYRPFIFRPLSQPIVFYVVPMWGFLLDIFLYTLVKITGWSVR